MSEPLTQKDIDRCGNQPLIEISANWREHGGHVIIWLRPGASQQIGRPDVRQLLIDRGGARKLAALLTEYADWIDENNPNSALVGA